MTTSNCMTCIYGGSWTGEQSTEPGYCYMFKDEPEGVCGQWKHSVYDEIAEVSMEQWDGLKPRTAGCTLCGHCAATGERIQPAQPVPDCRTCAKRLINMDYEYWCNNGCTNGDQYQPAPSVVLWRTE